MRLPMMNITRPAETKSTGLKRLDATAWTNAALDVLADRGIDGVRVEVLAKHLSVTKGSFYWHFKDRDALLDSMLTQWRQQATIALIDRLDRVEDSALMRLRSLLRLPITGKRSARAADVELAVRLWSRHDARAFNALKEVDQLRLRYIANLLIQCGHSTNMAEARAVIAYSYIRVASTLLPVDAAATMKLCETLLIGEG